MKREAALLALVILVASCAPRTVPVPPPAGITPKFPDFIQPVPPPGLGPPEASERHQVGWQWLQAGDLRAAERNFTSVLKQSASFYPADVGLGYVALASKRYKESLLHFDRAVVANPRYVPALAGRAEALLAMDQVEEAVASIEAALDQDPTLGALRSRLEVLRLRAQQGNIAKARALAGSNRLDEARAAYVALIEASPESPFLLRELADIERRAGNLDSALEHARRAIELEPDDARGHILLGELLEANGELAQAIDAFTRAAALQPDDGLAERVEALRSRAAFDAMPPEYRNIESSPTITRAQLAALFAVRLDELLKQSRRVNAVVITDTRGNWAGPYILSVARAGVMEVYPNHTFQPDVIVRRSDLAHAVSNVLDILAAHHPQLAASWRSGERRKFSDVSPRHFSYPAVALAVEVGIMSADENGAFNLAQPVTGAEAIAAVAKLEELGDRAVR